MDAPARVIFMGTPELARVVLTGLALDRRFQLAAVVAQPDRPAGRNLAPHPPPVKVEAQRLGIPLYQPEKAREATFLELLRSLAPDVIVVAAYGQILPQTLLDIPRRGCLNLHTSLLPRWRGAAPIQWAIASGDRETGVTLMQMEAGLDTGPMLASVRTLITPDDTGQTLHDRLAILAGELLLEHLQEHLAGRLIGRAQPTDGVTYARKVTREDARVDWQQPAVLLDRRRRAFTPWPGAHCYIPHATHPRLLKIHAARPEPGPGNPEQRAAPGTVIETGDNGILVACGSGSWRITELQLEGGKRMSAAQFLSGNRFERLE